MSPATNITLCVYFESINHNMVFEMMGNLGNSVSGIQRRGIGTARTHKDRVKRFAQLKT